MPTPKRRSPCPVSCTLDLIGDRWTLLVVRDLHLGRSTFKELSAGPEAIATNILSERLARLVSAGIVMKEPTPEHAGRYRYRLSKKGASLVPILGAIRDWGLENIRGTKTHLGG